MPLRSTPVTDFSSVPKGKTSACGATRGQVVGFPCDQPAGLAGTESPVVIAAFEGWNDAGEAASDAVEHLRGGLGGASSWPSSTRRTTTTSRSTGPTVGVDEDGSRAARGRTTRLLRGPPAPLGSRRRPARRRDRAQHAVAGVLPASCSDWHRGGRRQPGGRRSARCWPTSRTPGRSRSPAPRPTLSSGRALGLEQSRYEGPTGIVGVLQDACAQRGLPDGVLLGRRAALRRAAPLPQGHAGAARTASRTCSTYPIPLGDLPEEPGPGSAASTSWPPRTPRSPSTSLARGGQRTPTDLPEASGDAIAREFERYLRRREQDD